MGILSIFAQTVKDMDNNVYNFTKDGKCSHCGECCSALLPVTQEEYKTILDYVKSHHIKECRHALPLAGQTIDLTCPFLNTEKATEKCMIYPVRPLICRKFTCDSRQRPEWTMEEIMEVRQIRDMRKIIDEINKGRKKK